jgi:hypothetical protein
VLPCVSWHQLPPLASAGSGAATCPVVSTPASRLGAAQVSPRVPWCQLPPPGLGQLGCHHASVAPAPASLLEAARVPPQTHVTLQIMGYQSIRIFPRGITIVISYRGVRISSRTPHDKTGATHLQGMRRAVHSVLARRVGRGLQDYNNAAQTCCPLTVDRYSAG